MKKLNVLYLIIAALVIVSACNKEKRYSKRLVQKEDLSGVWLVSELSIDSQSDTVIPIWLIYDCDIYEDTCQGLWQANSDTANFVWQFQDKGNLFILNRVNGTDSCNFVTEISELQCYNYSGTYNVTQAKKKEMIFESETTVGYPGQKVKIVLERQE
ncbi:MAG: hypothetical protein ACI8Q1_001289 [Parvicella sp.]|jgi:hypothetical protein